MRFLKADRIFNGDVFLPAPAVLALEDDGTLHGILTDNSIEAGRIEKFNGTITPGFVNSHCHLELSHLRNKIPRQTGLPAFGKQVILQRSKFDAHEIADHMKAANAEMWNNGIVAVGDISNTAESFSEKAGSKIFYHTFVELIGLNPLDADTIFQKGLGLVQNLKQHHLKGSLVPHAPYSTSTKLIKIIADFDFENGQPFSIHNQESEDEIKFFLGEKNGFDDLYKFLNVDISWFRAPGISVLKSYAQVLSQGPSLLVHNRLTSKIDLGLIASKNIFWCFCPGANLYIDNALPDYEVFNGLQGKICIGTDSLASNSQLNILAEANIILQATAVFSVENMLAAITSRGAEALGIAGDYGRLISGKNAGLNLIDFQNSEIHFIKKII